MIAVAAAARPAADQIRRWAAEAVEGLRPDPVQSLWQQLLEQVARWWDTIVLPTGGLSAGGAAAVVVALLSVVAVALLLRRTHIRMAHRSRAAHTSPQPETEDGDPEVARAAAAALAAAGRYRDAVRARYRAMLAELERRGALPPCPARTNWEAVAVLRTEPVGAPLWEATTVFERVWYGMAQAGPETYAQADRLCDAVERAQAAA
ncbi:MAG: DUF4129 domain-containing protein [Armatimonadota bacterium]|nr:DUF4129 domain-containing protein [Armatimonadota bacterium]MDR5696109.1 DUF4129 domain-containing protein [Armatimonadota bacterium]